MTLIKKPTERTQSKINLKGLIYGQPGVGKTSIALSAPSPLLIDFDNGLRRVAKQYQTDSVEIKSYQNLLDILTKENIANYETIIIDTLGKLVDKIGDWLAESNPKIKQGDGQLSMKGWGSVKTEFQRLLKLLEGKNKSVIFTAHEKEEKVDDKIIKRPDVAGSSGKDIVKELDFMGYMSIKNGKRVLDLEPNEFYYAKNSLELRSYLEYIQNGTNNFLSDKIFDAYRKKLEKDNEVAKDYYILIKDIETKISNIANVEQLNLYKLSILNTHDQIWSSYEKEKYLLNEKAKELNCEFNKIKKEFEVKKSATILKIEKEGK